VPPLLVVAGFLPVLVAREAATRPETASPIGAAVGVAVVALLVAFGIVTFLGRLRTAPR
jgi:hypothetical protein